MQFPNLVTCGINVVNVGNNEDTSINVIELHRSFSNFYVIKKMKSRLWSGTTAIYPNY